MRRRRKNIAAMVLALRIAARGAAASLSAAAVAAPPAVTPHVAYYEMTLKSAGSTANVADVRGALVFDWSLACDAYVVEQQAAIQFFYDGGASESIGWTFRTTEAFDQSRYVFEMERTRGGSVSERITGEGAMAVCEGAGSGVTSGDGSREHAATTTSNTARLRIGRFYFLRAGLVPASV